jgi:DNA-directed RNA polymerase subunit RPC12/RpoP
MTDYEFACVKCFATLYVDNTDLVDRRGKECRYCGTYNTDAYIRSKMKEKQW